MVVKQYDLRYVGSLEQLATKVWKKRIDPVTCPSSAELSYAIESAARNAFLSLFSFHLGDYYYCSLITTGEAHAPIVSAWSWQALDSAVRNTQRSSEEAHLLKWSYSDSPFFRYGWEYFAQVREVFDERPRINALMTDVEWEKEYNFRLSAIENAMATLDAEGIFGTGDRRDRVVILVEVVPPDRTNVDRAIRLNPLAALREWLAEAAEF